MTRKQKGAAEKLPAAPQLLSRWSRAENAPLPGCQALAGDPSEVTALETRHWITSFLVSGTPNIGGESAAVKTRERSRFSRSFRGGRRAAEPGISCRNT